MKRAVALLWLLAGVAHADVKKRPMPDYDGRGDEPTTAGDVLIWVPRVVVSPLYLVTEFVLRRPARWLVITGEREQWPTRIFDFLFDRPIGLIPTFFVDLGFRPTVGFYFFWNDAGFTGNQVRATGSLSADVLTATALDRVNIGGWQLAVRGHGSSRSDNSFYGLGPLSLTDDLGRYEEQRFEGALSVERRFPVASRLRLEGGFRSIRFGDDGCCDDPTLMEQVDAGRYALPPGITAGGYDAPYARARLVLDTRKVAPATGVALAVESEAGLDPGSDLSWLRSSATLGGSLDLTGTRRVVSLILHAGMTEALTHDDEVPFTEQSQLGGTHALSGFRAGRVMGRSVVAATLQYEWPVWAYLGGALHAGVGNAFGKHFDGFDTDLLRLSAGIGIRSLGPADHRFELLVAVGTEPFDQGGEIDSVRVVIGGSTGF